MHPGRGGNARALALASSLLVACRATPGPVVAPPQQPGPPNEAPKTASLPISGRVDTRVVARRRETNGGDDDDLDVFSVLSLDVGESGVTRWTGHVTARAAWDVDGASPSFPQLADLDGDRVSGQVYDAYARTEDFGWFEELTLGRQFLYDTPLVVWLDGASFRTRERGARRWSTGAYAGVPVRVYEGDSNGDFVVGLYEQFHPRADLRLRADWLYVEDQRLGFDDGDALAALTAQYDATEQLRTEAFYSRIEDQDRDVKLSASWADYEGGWTLQASWYRLLERQTQRALELDPFFDTLFALEPFEQVRALLARDFGLHTHLDLGVDARRLVDDGVEGTFNHEFERYFATATFDRLLPADVVLAVTGEVWNGDAASFDTWGLDLSRSWNRKLDASLGSVYALYKFDPFDASEREDVRTYYAFVRYRASESATLSLRAEFEDNALGDFASLRGGATWKF